MSKGLVHFVHGKESGPNGSKIVALAQVIEMHRHASDLVIGRPDLGACS